MTHFAMILAICFQCLTPDANESATQPPRVPATELEGIWQEPAPPGETPGLRYRITFAGDEVSIEANGEIMRGTFRIDADAVPATMRIDIETLGVTLRSLSGVYRQDKEHLTLQIRQTQRPRVRIVDPGVRVEPAEPRWRDTLELAPLTITLAKTKK
jgi:hypothetical protein